jgi:hypothetical protein
MAWAMVAAAAKANEAFMVNCECELDREKVEKRANKWSVESRTE